MVTWSCRENAGGLPQSSGAGAAPPTVWQRAGLVSVSGGSDVAHRPCFRASLAASEPWALRTPPRQGRPRTEGRWGSGLPSSSGGRTTGPCPWWEGRPLPGAGWAPWAPLPGSELSLTRRPRSGRSARGRSLSENSPDPRVAATAPPARFQEKPSRLCRRKWRPC